jgi:hypothetical protein
MPSGRLWAHVTPCWRSRLARGRLQLEAAPAAAACSRGRRARGGVGRAAQGNLELWCAHVLRRAVQVQEAPPSTSTRPAAMLSVHALGAMAVGGVRRAPGRGSSRCGMGILAAKRVPGGSGDDVPRDQHSRSRKIQQQARRGKVHIVRGRVRRRIRVSRAEGEELGEHGEARMLW